MHDGLKIQLVQHLLAATGLDFREARPIENMQSFRQECAGLITLSWRERIETVTIQEHICAGDWQPSQSLIQTGNSTDEQYIKFSQEKTDHSTGNENDHYM